MAPLLALLLPGCGFQLQGRVLLPSALKSPWIETEDGQTDFVVDLRRALRRGQPFELDGRGPGGVVEKSEIEQHLRQMGR